MDRDKIAGNHPLPDALQPDHSRVSRRDFLRITALASASMALTSCYLTPYKPESKSEIPGPLGLTTRAEKIAIIGAGMAGLVAGYELTRAGHQVTILEARDRIGGRILTLRSPFSDGLFAEAGASRIPSNHHVTHWYINHLGLELEPFFPRERDFLLFSEHKQHRVPAHIYLHEKMHSDPDADLRMGYQKIRGGMDHLSQAFASALEDKIQLSSPVLKVWQTDDEVILETESSTQLSVDRVICTAPLPTVKTIHFSPQLSAEKQAAINGGYYYSPSARVFFQFPQRFWESKHFNGWAQAEWPEEIWHPTWQLPQSKGVLMSYMRYEVAEKADNTPESLLANQTLKRINTLFHGNQQHMPEKTFIHSWSKEPWSQGGWTHPTPDQYRKLGPHVEQPEGRIHFAGEHASQHHGWIQGALISGLRAAREIHEKTLT